MKEIGSRGRLMKLSWLRSDVQETLKAKAQPEPALGAFEGPALTACLSG